MVERGKAVVLSIIFFALGTVIGMIFGVLVGLV